MKPQELHTETDEGATREASELETSESPQPEETSEEAVEDASVDELESVKKEAKDNYDRFLRLSAEFDNYKKRTAREMNDFRKFANETIIKELLPVVDNLERAIESSGTDETSSSCVVEGVEMTLKAILKVFSQFEVTQVQSLGKPFDPLYHEAMMREESDEYPENTVIKELQKGYLLHDRLIRPALVVVSAAKKE